MVIVFVVDERLNLAHQVLSLTSCEYFKANAERQSHFLLQYIEPTVDNDESELAIQQVCTQILKATLRLLLIFAFVKSHGDLLGLLGGVFGLASLITFLLELMHDTLALRTLEAERRST